MPRYTSRLSSPHRNRDVRHVCVAQHFVERFEIGLRERLRLGRRILQQALQDLDLIELPCGRRRGVVLDAAEELRDALRDGRRSVDDGRTGPAEAGRGLAALGWSSEFQAGCVDFLQQIGGGFLDVLGQLRFLVVLERRVKAGDGTAGCAEIAERRRSHQSRIHVP
ncbi:MAG TPA: hypothetical protein VGQ65_19500 [Thermoanaerobaculia bacterium]|nr:hypothetical protein [Thermoanaerobaculia bacterium]